jgi:hypothetical protein
MMPNTTWYGVQNTGRSYSSKDTCKNAQKKYLGRYLRLRLYLLYGGQVTNMRRSEKDEVWGCVFFLEKTRPFLVLQPPPPQQRSLLWYDARYPAELVLRSMTLQSVSVPAAPF